MKKTEIQRASSEELIERYEELATTRGAQLETGSPKAANRAFQEEIMIRRELNRREPDGLRLLLPLLTSSNPWVQLDAATPILFLAPQEAEPVLQQLSQRPRMLGMAASMNLEQWRNGKLNPSWEKRD